ncbi:hypothetical protein KM92DES2_10813 [uncultured Desulfovibrio sp.]|uniref:Uncharacterized protein n=2 Tax=Desulfovibrio TaxID=872 RepID=A0A212JB08_9BACT|nr:hypothetical protein KM92DES2_10813 [uncultured Desulfovibrio sp.]
MTCPASNPKAPIYTCWQRIPGITDPQEIRRCQQCPHGMVLIASVTWQREVDQDVPDQVDAPQRENIIMDKQTYTVAQLSALIGISVKNIYNAKGLKRPPSSGSMTGAVLTEMSKRGITWDQIVPASKGGGQKTAGAPVPDDGQMVTDGSATAAEDSQTVAAVQKMPDAVPTVMREVMCERWPLEVLIKAVRGKLPPHTSITISA